MKYWFAKDRSLRYFSWGDLVKDKKAVWDGVRNFQARKTRRRWSWAIRPLFYHTGDEKAVVGIAQVSKAGYPIGGCRTRTAVDLIPVTGTEKPVPLVRDKTGQKLRPWYWLRLPAFPCNSKSGRIWNTS